MALGKAAVGIGKGIKGHLQSKNAGSAGLVDPTQSAMVNLMHRERRAMATGTSDAAARGNLAKEGKQITRRSILGGKRDLSQYIKLRAQNEKAIVEGRASERLGMLKSLTDETRNQADRSMDLVELQGDRDRLHGEAAKQTGGKNLMSQIPVLQEALENGNGNSAGSGNSVKTAAPSTPSDNPKLIETDPRKKKNLFGGLKGALSQAKDLMGGLSNGGGLGGDDLNIK
jgi:hypothetical protein